MSDAAVSHETASDRALRGPRIIFYLGALTVTETALRPALGLSLSMMFFLTAFAGCVVAVLIGHRVATVPGILAAGVFTFALGGLISSAGADSPADSAISVLRGVFVMLLLAWTGAMVLRTRRHVLLAISLWTTSAAANGVAAITDLLHVHVVAGASEGVRVLGLTNHANDLGGGAAVAFVPCLMLTTGAAVSGPLGSRTVRWLLVALVGAAIVLSGSVAAMLAALVATLVWLISPSVRAPARVLPAMALLAAVVVAAAVGGAVPSPTQRFEEVTAPSSVAQLQAGSGQARLEEVKTAFSRIADDPIAGRGLDAAGAAVTIWFRGEPSVVQVHGAPVAAWYEAGILGLLGLLVVVTALATAGWRGVAAASAAEDRIVGWSLLAAFFAWLVAFLANPFYFQEWGWFSGAMLFAWAAQSRRRAGAASRRPGRPAPAPALPPRTRQPTALASGSRPD
jgi:hypothetical protein